MATAQVVSSVTSKERAPAVIARSPQIVMTRTPLRISFGGGGTDLAEFYRRDYGAVFSSAIDKYVYVTVKRHSEVFFESIRVNYSQTEQCVNIDDIKNNIVRECLRFLQIDPPIYVSTVADLPASTGLGGSSSFTVGLLHALHAYRGESVSAGQLADEACHIEIDVLNEPIGKQDQYAAAFGGLNVFRFNRDGAVAVEPLHLSAAKVNDLFDQVVLYWTGISRDASKVLQEQKSNLSKTAATLASMRDQAHMLRSLFLNGTVDIERFGSILDQGWRMKRSLAGSITEDQIDKWYDAAIAAGADGGKLCGAGGGGFLLLVVRRELQDVVTGALGLMPVNVQCDVHGSRVLLPSGS